MRQSRDIEQVVRTYSDAVWRACMLHAPSQADAQDAFQDTFVKYAQSDGKRFNDSEHVKAWLIRVAVNRCKDMARSAARGNVTLEEANVANWVVSSDSESQPGSAEWEAVEAMRSLDDPPRTPLYLALCEGYSAQEIADQVGAPVGTVYSWISRGKAQLREALS